MKRLDESAPLLSLFSGCGGLDAGFTRAGFRIGLALDKDPIAVSSYNHNLAPAAKLLDLSRAHPEEILSAWSRVAGGPPAGIIGGPPCQAFSTSNVSDTHRDPRKTLIHKYSRIVSEFASAYSIDFCVFENVTGLLAERHRHHFRKLKSVLSDAGLEVFELVLDAQEFGVPQSRKRVFVIGVNQKSLIRVAPFPRSRARQKTVRDAIEHLPEPAYFSRGADAKSFPAHPNHWTMVPKSNRFHTSSTQHLSRSFRVLDWDRPSWTVAYGHREVHVHPDGHRRLSVFEAMLLQGFPRHFELLGNLSDQYRQVSDSVPPPLAAAVARWVRKLVVQQPPHSSKMAV